MHKANDEERAILLRESFLADLGEFAGPLTHEINNLLNTLSLYHATRQQAEPADLDSDVLAIRRQISQVAEVTLRYQRYRRESPLEPQLLDLNLSLGAVVDELATTPAQVQIVLETEPDLPRVRGYEADVRRLWRFLLINASRAVPPEGPAVVARTSRSEGGVLLQVECAGPTIPTHALPWLFELCKEEREGMSCLELAACRSIVHRMNGRLHAEGRPGGGLIVSARFACQASTT